MTDRKKEPKPPDQIYFQDLTSLKNKRDMKSGKNKVLPEELMGFIRSLCFLSSEAQ